MMDQYHMDLGQFSLSQFRQALETGRLLPSQRMLGEAIPERFERLAAAGITNLQDLLDALHTKKKTEHFAQASGLSVQYLTLLRRRAMVYTPRPVPLAKFPGVDPDCIGRLAAAGIKDTRQLFACTISAPERAALSERTGVPAEALLELVKLSDLVRAPYVGPVFARILYEAGADSLKKLAQSVPETLVAAMVAANEAQKLTQSAIPTPEDMQSSIDMAKMIPRSIIY